MQRKFLSNLLLLILLNLVVKPLAIFGIDATVQNRVGSEAYGFYYSLLNFTLLFNILLDLGINNFTTKNVAQFPSLMLKYMGRIMGLRMLLFIVYALIMLVLILVLGYPKAAYPIIAILIVQQFVISLIAYFRSYLSGMMLFRLDAILSVLDRALLIVICGALLLVTKGSDSFRIDHFVWVQFGCYVLSFLVGLYFITKHVQGAKIRIHKPISLLIVRQSAPYALLIVLMSLFTRVDSVMLERLLPNGAEQAGLYAQGFRFVDALFMFAMLFSNLLLPIFSKMIADKSDVRLLFETSSKLLIWGAIAVGSFLFWNAKEVLDFIYVNDTTASSAPFSLLALTFIAMCIVLIFGTYLTALGAMKILNTISFIALLFNVIFNFYLIPQYGAYGAAIATLITQGFVAVVQVFYVKRQLLLNWQLVDYLRFLLFSALLLIGGGLMQEYHFSMVLQLIVISLLVMAFKVIHLKAFLAILRGSK